MGLGSSSLPLQLPFHRKEGWEGPTSLVLVVERRWWHALSSLAHAFTSGGEEGGSG